MSKTLATLLTLRLSRQVNANKIRAVCEAISTFETPMVTFPGLNQPEHIAHLYELNIWTGHPETLKGYVRDFNEEWPGLQMTLIDYVSKKVLVSPLLKEEGDGQQ